MKQLFFIGFLLISSLSFSQGDYALAENYFRQGEYQKAIVLYKKLQNKSPYSTTYLKRLVTCYQEINQLDEAETLLKSLLKKSPKLSYINVEIGYNFQKKRQPEKAKKYYDIAIESIAENPSLGGIISRLFKNNNLLDYAITAYTRTMELNPNANYGFQLAQIYGEKGDFEKMFNAYVDLVDKNDNYIITVQRYAGRFLSDDPTDKNNIAFKKALLKKSVSKPKNIWNELLSWLFAKQKEFNKALVQEKALFKRNPEFLGKIFSLGTVAIENKDYAAAKNCFQFVLENTNFIKDKINAEQYLLSCAVALKEKDIQNKFTAFFTKYGINSNTIEVQVDFADYLTFTLNQPKEAEKILEKALNLPGSKFQQARIKLRLGDIYVFTGRFSKALIYYSQVQTKLKNHPLSQEARFKVAKASFFKGDFDWSMAQLKILKGSTTQLIANDAVDLFLVISENIPRDSLPTGLKEFAKADLLSFQNKTKEAIAVYDTILQNFKGQSIENATLYKQALLYRKEADFDAAIKNLEMLAGLGSSNTFIDDAYFLLAEIYRTDLNMPEKASEYYQKIIFEQSSSIYLVEARKQYRKLRGDSIN